MVLALLVFLAGCRSWKVPVPVEQVDFGDRSQTLVKGDLTVTIGVPDRAQTKAIFGTSLYKSRIQPVWIEVRNESEKCYTLIKSGMDRNYFSPLETSWSRHTGGKKKNQRMDSFFFSMDFPNPVDAGETSSGFVFTRLDEGFKAVLVDLVASNEVSSFTFVVEIPGLVTDLQQRDFDSLYEEITEISTGEALRMVLASLPSCTTSKKGDKNGDPLNIAMIGESEHVFSALIRSDWHVTEITYGASAWKTIKSFLFGARYSYSPISPLYVFGRSQDLGMQKARNSIHMRNHMRLWLTPYTYNGDPVWVGQISRDIGVKFSKRTVITHAIDPDIDDTRDGLIGDLAYSQALCAVGYAKGSQRSTLQETHYNLTPDPYYSDGLRAILFFGGDPHALDEIQILDWERPIHTQDRIKMLENYHFDLK